MVCRGSFDFQDRICESHTQSYGSGLTLTQSHRLPRMGSVMLLPAHSTACTVTAP